MCKNRTFLCIRQDVRARRRGGDYDKVRPSALEVDWGGTLFPLSTAPAKIFLLGSRPGAIMDLHSPYSRPLRRVIGRRHLHLISVQINITSRMSSCKRTSNADTRLVGKCSTEILLCSTEKGGYTWLCPSGTSNQNNSGR